LLLKTAEAQALALASAPSPAVAASIVAQHRRWQDLWSALPSDAKSLADSWHALNLIHSMPRFSDQRQTVLPQWQRYQLLAAQLKGASDKVPQARRAVWLRDIDRLELQLQQATPADKGGDLAAWQTWLAPQEVLVRFVLGESKSRAIWLRNQQLEQQELPARAVLVKMIAAAQSSQAAAKALSELLLPSAYLQGSERLWLMPDVELHTIPFAALAQQQPESVKGVIVIAGYALPERAFVKALPTGFRINSLQLAGRAPLPGAARIRQRLAGRFGARFQQLAWQSKAVIAAAEVFHFAGHGWANAAFPGAAALSADAPNSDISTSSNHVDVSALQFAHPPRLIVLSACEAAGVDQFGAGLSLARAFAVAQGSLVLAPLQMIDDAAALQFDQDFFASLENLPADQALMQALRTQSRDRQKPLPPWQLIISASLGESAATRQ
jgi:CHAT domain-containing protein